MEVHDTESCLGFMLVFFKWLAGDVLNLYIGGEKHYKKGEPELNKTTTAT